MPTTASPPNLMVGYGTRRTELPREQYTGEQYTAAQRAVEAAIGIEASGEAVVIVADGRRVTPTDRIPANVKHVEFLTPVDPLG